MKKIILAISAVCAAACLSACGGGTKPAYDHYKAMDEMFNAGYSKITVSVTNAFDADTQLNSSYEMLYSGDEITVNYSIERFTGISLDTGDAEKTVTDGTAKIKNGAVVSDSEGLLEVVPGMKFSFKAEYFSNVNEDIIDMFLKADVVNPSAFIGTDIKCTDMKVNAEYFTEFKNMEISYKGESGNSVRIIYNFTV